MLSVGLQDRPPVSELGAPVCPRTFTVVPRVTCLVHSVSRVTAANVETKRVSREVQALASENAKLRVELTAAQHKLTGQRKAAAAATTALQAQLEARGEGLVRAEQVRCEQEVKLLRDAAAADLAEAVGKAVASADERVMRRARPAASLSRYLT